MPMDKGDLTKLLLNIMYEVTAPGKTHQLDIPSLVSILSLVNLLGIVNYVSASSNVAVPAMVENSASETRDLFSTLLGSLGSLKSGSTDNQQNLNPQTLMMILNLLANLNRKKSEDHLEPSVTVNE